MRKAGYNEPDDIRQYDNHPQSPYYDEPDYFLCEICLENCDWGDESDTPCVCNECEEEDDAEALTKKAVSKINFNEP